MSMSSQNNPRQVSSMSMPGEKVSQNGNEPAAGSVEEEPARDSIYEAEGEQSSIERSQPDLFDGTNNYDASAASNGLEAVSLRQSAEGLIDPHTIGQDHAATMKSQVLANALSAHNSNAHMPQNQTTKTEVALLAHQILAENASGSQMQAT